MKSIFPDKLKVGDEVRISIHLVRDLSEIRHFAVVNRDEDHPIFP